MKRFSICFMADGIYHTKVEAETEEEAIRVAKDEAYNEAVDWELRDCEELTSKNDTEAEE